jgi:hypothetical protein
MIRRVAILGVFLTRVASAQTPASSNQSIAGALLPLPEPLRAGASVVRVDASSHLDTLRQGTNGMTCIADAPNDDTFDVRCYRDTFIPVVYRAFYFRPIDNRALAAEIKAGTFKLSAEPTAGYRCEGPISAYDASRNEVSAAIECWQSVHFPFRTAAEVGLSEEAAVPERLQRDVPYVMASGTFWSHVMIRHPDHR